jgi:D-glycero-D-manno-heptose 1,7-bisphosphate phosphatase
MALIDGVGCWRRAAVATVMAPGRPAVFLDRDGVLVEEVGYLGDPRKVALIPGAGEAVAELNRAGAPVIVVTNQAGIARGYYGWSEFEAVEREIERRLSAEGAHLDAVLACAYHAAGSGALGVASHPWRKPAPGMLLDAAAQWGIDLGRSWIVGDKASDLEAGRAAGLAGGLHVATGHGEGEERRMAEALASPAFRVVLAADLASGLAQLDVAGLSAA